MSFQWSSYSEEYYLNQIKNFDPFQLRIFIESNINLIKQQPKLCEAVIKCCCRDQTLYSELERFFPISVSGEFTHRASYIWMLLLSIDQDRFAKIILRSSNPTKSNSKFLSRLEGLTLEQQIRGFQMLTEIVPIDNYLSRDPRFILGWYQKTPKLFNHLFTILTRQQFELLYREFDRLSSIDDSRERYLSAIEMMVASPHKKRFITIDKTTIGYDLDFERLRDYLINNQLVRMNHIEEAVRKEKFISLVSLASIRINSLGIIEPSIFRIQAKMLNPERSLITSIEAMFEPGSLVFEIFDILRQETERLKFHYSKMIIL